MRLISTGFLRDFWESPGHGDAETPLKTWAAVVRKAQWADFAAVRRDFPASDLAHGRVVFNIAGHKYRLIARVDFVRHGVLVLWIGTHKAYDRLCADGGRRLKAL